MKKLLLFLAIAGGAFFLIVAFFFVSGVVKGFREASRHGGSDAAIERRLAAQAKEINAELPQMQDGGVRVDSVVAGPGARLTYTCTLINISAANLDSAKFASTAKLKLLDHYKTSPRMAPLRKMEVELAYNYVDKDGKAIATIVVSPKDL